MNSPKRHKLQRLIAPIKELEELLSMFKFKYYQHLEERSSYNLNQRYVSFLEENINELENLIKERKIKTA